MSSPTVLDVPNGPLLGPVLGRVVRFLCARENMDIDRLSDAALVTDALAAGMGDHAINGRLRVTISTGDGRVVLDVGPFAGGGAQRLIRADSLSDLGSVLGALADVVGIESHADGDHLRVELARRTT